jgi:ubiquitin carboxyl-terminal hydrolase 25/28
MQLKEEVEIGAQQDVTEVINNVLFQSQCAIQPREIGDGCKSGSGRRTG